MFYIERAGIEYKPPYTPAARCPFCYRGFEHEQKVQQVMFIHEYSFIAHPSCVEQEMLVN